MARPPNMQHPKDLTPKTILVSNADRCVLSTLLGRVTGLTIHMPFTLPYSLDSL